MRPYTSVVDLPRHIRKPREVQLVRHSDIRGRAVTVLAEDDVRFTTARVVAVDGVRAVQQHDHVGVLLQTIMRRNTLCHKVMRSINGTVVDVLLTDAGDLDNLVPEHIIGSQVVQFTIPQRGRDAVDYVATR